MPENVCASPWSGGIEVPHCTRQSFVSLYIVSNIAFIVSRGWLLAEFCRLGPILQRPVLASTFRCEWLGLPPTYTWLPFQWLSKLVIGLIIPAADKAESLTDIGVAIA